MKFFEGPARIRPERLARGLVVIGAAALLAACQSSATSTSGAPTQVAGGAINPMYASMYGPVQGEPFPVAAVDLTQIDPAYYRQEVALPRHVPNRPGVIVVDPADRFLYLVMENRRAMRYGIGVGREGFAWNGEATIKAKREWPKWFPPPEMVARDPQAAPWADGMPGGPQNPLGARALYLYQGNKDTLYRIHGTNQPASIGRAMSSGCIRMLNQDIMDLYERVPMDTQVVVLTGGPAVASASPAIVTDPIRTASISAPAMPGPMAGDGLAAGTVSRPVRGELSMAGR